MQGRNCVKRKDIVMPNQTQAARVAEVLARRVMGWEDKGGGIWKTNPSVRGSAPVLVGHGYWSPLESVADAVEVADKMRHPPFSMNPTIQGDGPDYWLVRLQDDPFHINGEWCSDDLPAAICRAIFAALGEEWPEGEDNASK